MREATFPHLPAVSTGHFHFRAGDLYLWEGQSMYRTRSKLPSRVNRAIRMKRYSRANHRIRANPSIRAKPHIHATVHIYPALPQGPGVSQTHVVLRFVWNP